uniref:HTH_Tnp_Tc3_1 domain-containing protein n=2 Tax=Caenorhabditis japonica TaxID=281687 RepID=A0A8R1IMG0_CAEJA
MHQLGSSLHMISRYVKKSRSAIRSFLNNPLFYGKKKSTGRPRKVTSCDERNIIRVVSDSPKSLNNVRAELNLSVCKQNVHNTITRKHNEKSYEEKIPVGASRNSVLAQQQCGVELGP